MKIENMELGLKGWWNTVNKITGRDSKALNISSVINPVDINLFFQRISTDTVLSPGATTIPEGNGIPTLDVDNVRRFMTLLKRASPGPNGIPYCL